MKYATQNETPIPMYAITQAKTTPARNSVCIPADER
jgi:hypothetical protein